jgi:hypothetical protein
MRGRRRGPVGTRRVRGCRGHMARSRARIHRVALSVGRARIGRRCFGRLRRSFAQRAHPGAAREGELQEEQLGGGYREAAQATEAAHE